MIRTISPGRDRDGQTSEPPIPAVVKYVKIFIGIYHHEKVSPKGKYVIFINNINKINECGVGPVVMPADRKVRP
jgi:hypothetical protein